MVQLRCCCLLAAVRLPLCVGTRLRPKRSEPPEEWSGSCKETGMEATSTTQSTNATATTPPTGRKTKAKEKQTGE